jgi:hypothetical protein
VVLFFVASSLFPLSQSSPHCAAMSVNFPIVYMIFFLSVSSFLSSMSNTPSIYMTNISSLSSFPSKALTSMSLVDMSGDGVQMGIGRVRSGEFDLVELEE